MCTLISVYLLYTAASSAVVPAAAQLWWRKLSLSVSSAPQMDFIPSTETHFAKTTPELPVLKSLPTLRGSQKNYYTPHKILLFTTFSLRTCGYVNTGMTSRDRNYSINCHNSMLKPQMWLWHSDNSCYKRISNLSLLIPQTNCWQTFLMVF